MRESRLVQIHIAACGHARSDVLLREGEMSKMEIEYCLLSPID